MTVLEAYRKAAYLQVLAADLLNAEGERIERGIEKLKKNIPIRHNKDNETVYLEENSPVLPWVEQGLCVWEVCINRASISAKDTFPITI